MYYGEFIQSYKTSNSNFSTIPLYLLGQGLFIALVLTLAVLLSDYLKNYLLCKYQARHKYFTRPFAAERVF